MAEKLFALSEDTKDKVLELIGRKPAPDRYANKTPVMREYYSRMWIVKLDEDLPRMYDDRSGNNNLNCVDAYVFEVNDDERLVQRVWNSENVKLRKKVYNQSRETLPAKDEDGNHIFYTAIQDMLGTIWVQPRVKNEYFVINKGWNGEGTPPNNPSVYTKGSLHYVKWDGADWVPLAGNERTPATVAHARPGRLVVCQGDAPTGAKDFPMRYFTPESNMGVNPKISSSATFSGSRGKIEERCGVLLGEHEFTDKMFDYCVTTNSDYTYNYSPQFITSVSAVGTTGGNNNVFFEYKNVQYLVNFPNDYSGLSGAGYPDIYPGDDILILFDCDGMQGWALDYAKDYPEGTIMPWYRPNPWTSPAQYCGRGWQQYVPTGGQGEITAVNIDKNGNHYDTAGDCIWVEAGVNDKIQVKEGSLCFIEKVKTNAIL